MWLTLLINFVLPMAVKTVETYINSTETKNDDKILEVTKIGASYLAENYNNNVTQKIANELNSSSMVKVQKSSLDF